MKHDPRVNLTLRVESDECYVVGILGQRLAAVGHRVARFRAAFLILLNLFLDGNLQQDRLLSSSPNSTAMKTQQKLHETCYAEPVQQIQKLSPVYI